MKLFREFLNESTLRDITMKLNNKTNFGEAKRDKNSTEFNLSFKYIEDAVKYTQTITKLKLIKVTDEDTGDNEVYKSDGLEFIFSEFKNKLRLTIIEVK